MMKKTTIYCYNLIAIISIIVLNACSVDSTDYELKTTDVFIDEVIIEAANNDFLEEDVVASVTNHARTIVASLPSSSKDKKVVLTIKTPEGITTTPASGEALETGNTNLLVQGFGLEEEYSVNLKVLEPFQSDEEFISVWRVDANQSITLPLIETGNYNFKVFWGDGETSIVAAYDLASATHTYTEAGDYTLTVWGVIEGFNFGISNISATNIIDITSWGQVKLGNDGEYFKKCSNLQVSALDAPDLSETTNFKAFFREASAFNSNINHWDVSTVTSMQDVFYKAYNYNQPLDNWDVSNVVTFETMFRESAFNQDISNWDVSSATTLKNMFRKTVFNQPIGNWDVANVTSFQSTFRDNDVFTQDLSGWGNKLTKVITMREMFRGSDYNGDLSAWDVSKVVSMWDMFKDSGFNNPSINNWDVSGLDNMETMFGGNLCAFNQDISNWNVSNVVNMQNLFKENLVFNQDLSGWDVSNVLCNYDFDKDAPQWLEAYKPVFTADKNDNNEFCNRSY